MVSDTAQARNDRSDIYGCRLRRAKYKRERRRLRLSVRIDADSDDQQQVPLDAERYRALVEAGFSAGSATGYCVYSDKDGDKFVESYSYKGGSTTGKGTLGSGTGKYKGIQGQFDWQQVLALPSDKGTYNYVGKKTGSYRIP